MLPIQSLAYDAPYSRDATVGDHIHQLSLLTIPDGYPVVLPALPRQSLDVLKCPLVSVCPPKRYTITGQPMQYPHQNSDAIYVVCQVSHRPKKSLQQPSVGEYFPLH
ncbi:hypothetical protein C0991_011159 [Blastosporella zonata]|nr:hypothetical protein C0991_011159 [Blastosporella zonata]